MDISYFLMLAAVGAVFVHNFRLSRKLAAVQETLREVSPALKAFCEAVDRSEKVVAGARKISSGAELQRTVSRPAPAAPVRDGSDPAMFYAVARERGSA